MLLFTSFSECKIFSSNMNMNEFHNNDDSLPSNNEDVCKYCTDSYSKSGSFFISNTTRMKALCWIGFSYPCLGETWNLTISVDSNSSSGINISAFYQYWTGKTFFQILPGHFKTEIYVSGISIDTSNAYPRFKIALMNSTGNASGTYHTSGLYRGSCPDIGTGQAIGGTPKNITEWLESLSSLTSEPSSSVPTTVTTYWTHLILIIVSFLLFCTFKRIKQKSE